MQAAVKLDKTRNRQKEQSETRHDNIGRHHPYRPLYHPGGFLGVVEFFGRYAGQETQEFLSRRAGRVSLVWVLRHGNRLYE